VGGSVGHNLKLFSSPNFAEGIEKNYQKLHLGQSVSGQRFQQGNSQYAAMLFITMCGSFFHNKVDLDLCYLVQHGELPNDVTVVFAANNTPHKACERRQRIGEYL